MNPAPAPLQALGICLEEYEYPYPVRFLPLANDLQQVAMAYMDIPPGGKPNGQTVVLMHGKAFGCYYSCLSRIPRPCLTTSAWGRSLCSASRPAA